MAKSIFASFVSRFGSRSCCPGSRIQPTFADSIDEVTGVATVIKVGETDLDEYIQSFRDTTDIYKILDRLTLSGGALPSVPDNAFADLSSLPTNVHEALKLVNSAKLTFDSLSPEIRKEYSNNFNEFIADFGSARFNKLFNSVNSNNTKEEVNTDVGQSE